MGLDQYPVTYTRIEGATANHVGRMLGKLGRDYTWKFIYDVSREPADQLSTTVQWEWMFRVYDLRGKLVYQAKADTQPLLREQATSRAMRDHVEYQAQLFLEEHLRLKMDAGSSSRHRIPGRSVSRESSGRDSRPFA